MSKPAFVIPEQTWSSHLEDRFAASPMPALADFLQQERQSGQVVFPPEDAIFRAFAATPFDKVKVVILGQDPYHGPGQAHGLSFSVPRGVRIPPSLRNIYKEIAAEYGAAMPQHGDLSSWAGQGVLLLNATLTVREAQAGSHQKRGWEDFTDGVIRLLSDQRDHIVFMLWGSYAQQKKALIEAGRHLVLEAPHPSPLSAHRGFLGCGHFRKANEYLAQHGQQQIDWLHLG